MIGIRLFFQILFVSSALLFRESYGFDSPGQRILQSRTRLIPSQISKGRVVCSSNRDCLFREGLFDEASRNEHVAAWGRYEDTMQTSGWGRLTIRSNARVSAEMQAYALGFLEGVLTARRIGQFYETVLETFPDNKDVSVDDVYAYWERQYQYIKSEIASHERSLKNDDDHLFWKQISLVVHQFEGLLAGFNSRFLDHQLTLQQLLFLNGDIENDDVASILSAKAGKPLASESMDGFSLIEQLMKLGRCSALIKLTSDRKVLYGHATWDDYTEMTNRMFKHIIFEGETPSFQRRISSFSGYPGILASTDDFIILDSGLVIMETTINVYNRELFEKQDERAVPTWMRVLAASHIAKNSLEWAHYFGMHTSGTNNNQWMIMDNKQRNKDPFPPGTFVVIEAVPSNDPITRDMTDVLEKEKYWASYNRPYFEETRRITHFDMKENDHGSFFAFSSSPRAEIFRREQNNVQTINAMKALVRMNRLNDSASNSCAGNAIAARNDLNRPPCLASSSLNGAIDAKVTSSEMALRHQAWAVAGPTWGDSADSPPFAFTGEIARKLKEAQLPTKWDFNWTRMHPDEEIISNERVRKWRRW